MPEVKVSQEHAEEMATRIRDLLTADTRKAVETYFTRDSYAGTAFNLLGDNDPYTLNSDDVLAARFLGVDIKPPAVRALLMDADIRYRVTALLHDIDPSIRLWDAAAGDAITPAGDLWTLLEGVPGIGWVIASKLLARKRPHLIPIADALVWEYLQPPKEQFWETLRQVLQDAELRQTIEEVLRPEALRSAEMMEKISTIRLLDVAVWMHMKGQHSAK